jgi:hypothetical protein
VLSLVAQLALELVALGDVDHLDDIEPLTTRAKGQRGHDHAPHEAAVGTQVAHLTDGLPARVQLLDQPLPGRIVVRVDA